MNDRRMKTEPAFTESISKFFFFGGGEGGGAGWAGGESPG